VILRKIRVRLSEKIHTHPLTDTIKIDQTDIKKHTHTLIMTSAAAMVITTSYTHRRQKAKGKAEGDENRG
jgi:hypothetical protein